MENETVSKNFIENEFILSLEIPSVNRLHNSDRPYISQTLLFTHHCPARCFGMNMPKSRDIQAKIL